MKVSCLVPSRLGLFPFFALIAIFLLPSRISHTARAPPHISAAISRCEQLKLTATYSSTSYARKYSDRYVPGTPPVLIKRARIWTGGRNGTQVIRGDVLMDKGLIKSVGHLSQATLAKFKEDLVIIDANNSWLTPGLVDMHSHIGNSPLPYLAGASNDWRSERGNIQPFLRTIDGLNTHDQSYELSVAGGITTALVLPGSNNAIGGQGFTLKLRKTAEKTPTSMLLEYPDEFDYLADPPKWQHLMHAYGENPGESHSQTRMDTSYALREAYYKASELRQAQDIYCIKITQGQWDPLGTFPDDPQLDPLVDVLRGNAKVHVHASESVDLDDMVRLSNEFKFPIAAIHQASEAYLVPDLLKKSFGQPPAIALSATNARRNRETYRSSEFAPSILSGRGLRVVMQSNHPRYLLYEAQQAYFYGLPAHLALASITTTPSAVMGLDHRVGFIRPGFDADIVIWDSHPMSLGATPKQVFIDGIPQLASPHVVHKPPSFQVAPEVPTFDKEAALAIEYDGLPPLQPERVEHGMIILRNVKSAFMPSEVGVRNVLSNSNDGLGVIVIFNGSVICTGSQTSCIMSEDARMIDLKGGSVSPGLISFGSRLGLVQNDLNIMDPFTRSIPQILGDNTIPHALDGLQFASRDALLAYRAGVTSAVAAPRHSLFLSGLSTFFSLGAMHKFDGGVIQDVVGLHMSIRHFGGIPSVSVQLAALRHLLFNPPQGKWAEWFRRITTGETPLVIEAHGADIIASLIHLKKEVEISTRSSIRMTITGASEAHILAAQLAQADIGVIVSPSRQFPTRWEDGRMLPGPPMTNRSAVAELLAFNVLVGVGIQEISQSRNTRFDLGWLAIEAGGSISQEQAYALASTNLQKLLGTNVELGMSDLVATEGGDLLDGMSSKVVAIISKRHESVHLL